MTQFPDDLDDDERQALEPLAADIAELRERHRDNPPLEVLRAARAGALPDDLQEQAERHLESNSWSRALVDGLEEAEADSAFNTTSADRLLTRIRKDSSRAASENSRRIWAPLLAFASLGGIVLAVVVWRQSSTTDLSVAPADQRPTIAAAPAPATFALQLTKADIKLTPAVLLRRGDDSGRLADDLAPAVNAYRGDDFETAARTFESLQAKYPRSVEVLFYLGVSRLFLNEAQSAERALQSARALNDESFNDDVSWYLAIAAERAGAIDQSRALVDSLCGGKSAYSARACAAGGSLRR